MLITYHDTEKLARIVNKYIEHISDESQNPSLYPIITLHTQSYYLKCIEHVYPTENINVRVIAQEHLHYYETNEPFWGDDASSESLNGEQWEDVIQIRSEAFGPILIEILNSIYGSLVIP